jgi:hypothetical protein
LDKVPSEAIEIFKKRIKKLKANHPDP